MSAPSPRPLLKAMAECPKGRFMTLARLLARLRKAEPDAFIALAQSAGVQRRRAYLLLQIADRFGAKPHLDRRLEAIGWTRLQVLIRWGPSSLSDAALMDLAEAHTAHELEHLLRHGHIPDHTRTVLFHLTEAQYAALEALLVQHGAVRTPQGLLHKEEALMTIVEADGKG